MFAIDTSDRGSLELAAPFVDKNGLVKRFGATQSFVSGRTDGHTHALLARAKRAQAGRRRGQARRGAGKHDPEHAQMRTSRAAWAMASCGSSTSRSIMRTVLYFEKNANFGLPDVFDRSGMWVERSASGFEVVDVIKDGPAAKAGLRAGNVIVAIDGKPGRR